MPKATQDIVNSGNGIITSPDGKRVTRSTAKPTTKSGKGRGREVKGEALFAHEESEKDETDYGSGDDEGGNDENKD